MAKIRPLEDRVVIQQIEAEEKTAGASCCRIPPRRSPSAAACSPWARARCSIRASGPDRRGRRG